MNINQTVQTAVEHRAVKTVSKAVQAAGAIALYYAAVMVLTVVYVASYQIFAAEGAFQSAAFEILFDIAFAIPAGVLISLAGVGVVRSFGAKINIRPVVFGASALFATLQLVLTAFGGGVV
jgi:hypothetical protein